MQDASECGRPLWGEQERMPRTRVGECEYLEVGTWNKALYYSGVATDFPEGDGTKLGGNHAIFMLSAIQWKMNRLDVDDFEGRERVQKRDKVIGRIGCGGVEYVEKKTRQVEFCHGPEPIQHDSLRAAIQRPPSQPGQC